MGALGVVHVPKCGGTAVRDALANGVHDSYLGPGYFDSDHFGGFDPCIPASSQGRMTSPDEMAAACGRHQLVMGHYSAANLNASGCRALATLVREPRSRILSLYRYLQSMSVEERHSWGSWGSEVLAISDSPIDVFLSSEQAWPITHNAMARQLLLQRNPDPPPDAGSHIQDSAVLSRSYQALESRLAVAEWTRDSSAFVSRICAFVGEGHAPRLSIVNETKRASKRTRLSRDAYRSLQALTALDNDLLRRMMASGLLPRRSARDLDDEFAETAKRMKIVVRLD